MAIAASFPAASIAIGWKVLGFSVAAALVTGVLAGLAPLWQAMRTAPNAVLSEGVRASAGAPARRLSKALVVAEIALAFTVLTTSAHPRRPPAQSRPHVTGLRPRRPRRVRPRLARTYSQGAECAEQARLMDVLRQTPGVTGAAFASQLSPGPICAGSAIHVEGRTPGAAADRMRG